MHIVRVVCECGSMCFSEKRNCARECKWCFYHIYILRVISYWCSLLLFSHVHLPCSFRPRAFATHPTRFRILPLSAPVTRCWCAIFRASMTSIPTRACTQSMVSDSGCFCVKCLSLCSVRYLECYWGERWSLCEMLHMVDASSNC